MLISIIKGLTNEHICASALYYYDSANITDSHLAFRENVNHEYLDASWTPGPTYEQHCYEALLEIFGLYGEDSMSVSPTTFYVTPISSLITFQMAAMQIVGQVLTREDRLLVFPNVLQHCVQPFQLTDQANQAIARSWLSSLLILASAFLPRPTSHLSSGTGGQSRLTRRDF